MYRKIRERFSGRSWTLLERFLLISVTVTAANLLFLVAHGGEGLSSLLWNVDAASVFTDFFESLRDAVRGNPYDYGCIYPPLSYVLLKILARIIPGDCADWIATAHSPGGMLAVYLFFFMTTALLLMLAAYVLQIDRRKTALLSLVLLLSPSYVFMIGQGNIILFALLALLFYCFFYRSENALAKC